MKCRECSGPVDVDERRAEAFCIICGLVNAENVVLRQGHLVDARKAWHARTRHAQERMRAKGRRLGRPPMQLAPLEIRLLSELRKERRYGARRLARALNAVRKEGGSLPSVSPNTVMRRMIQARAW